MNNRTIMAHVSSDWCHLCGRRSECSADVWYSKNAEHDDPLAIQDKYVRICSRCAQAIERKCAAARARLEGFRQTGIEIDGVDEIFACLACGGNGGRFFGGAVYPCRECTKAGHLPAGGAR